MVEKISRAEALERGEKSQGRRHLAGEEVWLAREPALCCEYALQDRYQEAAVTISPTSRSCSRLSKWLIHAHAERVASFTGTVTKRTREESKVWAWLIVLAVLLTVLGSAAFKPVVGQSITVVKGCGGGSGS